VVEVEVVEALPPHQVAEALVVPAATNLLAVATEALVEVTEAPVVVTPLAMKTQAA
jgi:hypothetical protein